jgi:hypothetical protein
MTELVENTTIKYDYALGVGGARFWLFPLKGVHTEEQIKAAIFIIKRDHDVISVRYESLEWEEWKKVPVWFHAEKDQNSKINSKFHKQVYEEYKEKINKTDNK